MRVDAAARVDAVRPATNVQGMSPVSAVKEAHVLHSTVRQSLLSNYDAFLRFVERRVGAHDIAEDILQETFARNLERLTSLRDPEAVVAWFYQALRNATSDHFRRGVRASRAETQLTHESAAVEAAPESAFARPCRCATRAASALKAEYADALQRIEVEGASLKTFAAERGISSTNAAVRVHRARTALRHDLEATCGSDAMHGRGSCGCEPSPSR